MKLRTSFVANSSSSSFILALKGNPNYNKEDSSDVPYCKEDLEVDLMIEHDDNSITKERVSLVSHIASSDNNCYNIITKENYRDYYEEMLYKNAPIEYYRVNKNHLGYLRSRYLENINKKYPDLFDTVKEEMAEKYSQKQYLALQLLNVFLIGAKNLALDSITRAKAEGRLNLEHLTILCDEYESALCRIQDNLSNVQHDLSIDNDKVIEPLQYALLDNYVDESSMKTYYELTKNNHNLYMIVMSSIDSIILGGMMHFLKEYRRLITVASFLENNDNGVIVKVRVDMDSNSFSDKDAAICTYLSNTASPKNGDKFIILSREND